MALKQNDLPQLTKSPRYERRSYIGPMAAIQHVGLTGFEEQASYIYIYIYIIYVYNVNINLLRGRM